MPRITKEKVQRELDVSVIVTSIATFLAVDG
jgi:hypothetical protein